MAEQGPRRAINVIPDDPEQSVYRFIIVAAKRARQLQSGQRSYLPGTTKKPTVTAMEEVRRGLINYWEAGSGHEAQQAPEGEAQA